MWAWLSETTVCMCASFFSLPRHDVVFPLIFHYLDTVEVWNLRAVSKDFLALCEEYFQNFCRVVLYAEHPQPHGRDSIITAHSMELTERRRMCVVNALRKCRKMEHFSLRLRSQIHVPNLQLRSCNSLMLSLTDTNCQLVSLTLQNVECSNDLLPCFEKLGGQCWRLRELHVEALTAFDDGCLSALTKNCTLIVRLTLKALLKLQGTCLEKLAEMCSQLEDLNMSGSCNVRSTCLERMIRKCQAMKTLNFSSMFSVVTDGTILSAKEYCDQLESLCIAQCSRVTDRYVVPLVQRGVRVEGMAHGVSKHHRPRILGQI